VPLFPQGVPASKRIFDLVTSGLGAIILSPLLIVLTGMVWAIQGPPILFRQKRPGYRAKPFYNLKYRTLNERRGEGGAYLPDAERMTPFGQFLRSTSLDELPELVNVLKGEMSLVGPRPLLMQYLERYSPDQARRHEVLPGMTGWAQVKGRNALSWEERFQLDVWYVDHWSFWLDLKILGLTLWKVIRREGISQPGHATMEEFMGRK
jgi:lipopolysaccharide/colanic/teichoic acid biosynthesis glycosyltransferase